MKKNLTLIAVAIAALGLSHTKAQAADAVLSSILINSGTASGSVASLRAFDGNALRVAARPGGNLSWTLAAGIHIPVAQVQTMRITLRTRKSSGALIGMSMFDYPGNRWVLVSQVVAPTTGWSNQTINVSNPRRFIIPGGGIRLRFDSVGSGTMLTDHIRIAVN